MGRVLMGNWGGGGLFVGDGGGGGPKRGVGKCI